MNNLLQHEQSLIRNAFQSLFGGFAQQNSGALVSFNRLLNAHSFDTIIEVGTHTGGFSLPFALYCYMSQRPAVCSNPSEPSLFVNHTHHRRPKKFYTYDIFIRDQSAIDAIEHLGGVFRQHDTLHNPDNVAAICEDIQRGGSVLLLCDGGNKKRELELYGGALKSGDFVCLHDWAYDEQAFERNKREGIWGSWESRWQNGEGEGQQFGIADICARYGIEPIYAEEFDKVAWFMGKKA